MAVTMKAKPKVGTVAKATVVVEEKMQGNKVGGEEYIEPVPGMVCSGESKVGVSLGTTINLGNYNSLRISVEIARPCEAGHEDESFEKVLEFVEEKLNGIVSSYGLHIGGAPDGE